MAKKFVEATGLSNVFSAVDITGGTATLKENIGQSGIIDDNSVLFITAVAVDSGSTAGYSLTGEVKTGDKFIYAKGTLFVSSSNLSEKIEAMDADIEDKKIELINLVS